MAHTFVILMLLGLGFSSSVPLMMLRKKTSNFLRLSPDRVAPRDQIRENRKRPCRYRVT
ncbi:hypothetical protein DPMN_030204 [Dreissena polymorpha]|uniref:Uncharacterized protein n=1 Tax=Dreissena polymorpha TaxID=45954 RepID=A0A9D4M002_DREPO|nr:hypothetical protein DPMN_030204 [Dreissena polymorpha]